MARFRRPLLIGLILLIAVGLGEFWLYSSNRLAGYLHQRTIGGVSLADLCQTSDIGGFPFRLKLNCNGFAAPLRAGGGVIVAGAEEAQGEASLFSPDHIILTLSSPLVLREQGGAPLAKLRHDGMTIDIAWTLTGLSQARIDMKSLDWRPEQAKAGVAFNLRDLTATLAPQASQDGGALRFRVSGDGLTVPALQALLKTSDLGQFTIGGAVTPPPAPASDWRAAVEDWRQKAGAIAIDQCEWSTNDMKLRAVGALSLDDAHRPAGKLDVTAEGIGPLLTGLGLPVGAVQAQGLVNVLLGKAATQAKTPNAISLPMTLTNGQIFIGPMRVRATVLPLY
jgi:hypothetical protein